MLMGFIVKHALNLLRAMEHTMGLLKFLQFLILRTVNTKISSVNIKSQYPSLAWCEITWKTYFANTLLFSKMA